MNKLQWMKYLTLFGLSLAFFNFVTVVAGAQTAGITTVGFQPGPMGFHPTAWWGYPPGTYVPPHPHSGYYPDPNARPAWAVGQVTWPAWEWLTPPPGEFFKRGQWQCIAFDHDLQSHVAVGLSLKQAANLAHAYCDGADYTGSGCYIPRGYCRAASAEEFGSELSPE